MISGLQRIRVVRVGKIELQITSVVENVAINFKILLFCKQNILLDSYFSPFEMREDNV